MGVPGSYLGDVHATILRQHAEIRARFRGLDASATSTASTAAYLRVSLFRLAALLESHLRYEELELVPRIRDLDAWGAVREAAMLTEHAEQRTRLEHACFLAESEATGNADLSREVSWLVVSLLDDMAREERQIVELEQLGLVAPLDQITG